MPSGAERYFERRRAMDRVEFEAALREEGYLEVADRRMEPNKTNPEHSHEFDAQLLVRRRGAHLSRRRHFRDERGVPARRAMRTEGCAVPCRASLPAEGGRLGTL